MQPFSIHAPPLPSPLLPPSPGTKALGSLGPLASRKAHPAVLWLWIPSRVALGAPCFSWHTRWVLFSWTFLCAAAACSSDHSTLSLGKSNRQLWGLTFQKGGGVRGWIPSASSPGAGRLELGHGNRSWRSGASRRAPGRRDRG